MLYFVTVNINLFRTKIGITEPRRKWHPDMQSFPSVVNCSASNENKFILIILFSFFLTHLFLFIIIYYYYYFIININIYIYIFFVCVCVCVCLITANAFQAGGCAHLDANEWDSLLVRLWGCRMPCVPLNMIK